MVECLAAELKKSDNLFMDETTVAVPDPGRGRTKTGYLWTMARDDRHWGGPDPPGVVYAYAPVVAGTMARRLLRGSAGRCRSTAVPGTSGSAARTGRAEH